ncbi:hypothetical protein TNCV_4556571 [Trichonephila clavipes]|nr:hypothetical protein TNCV_4556571 [Trichonephila clavipes]
MDVLTCHKSIPKVNLVPRPKHNTAIVGFIRGDDQGEHNDSKEMLKSVRVEERNKISTDEATKLVKCMPNILRELQKEQNSLKSIKVSDYVFGTVILKKRING